jgi:hypothetical protein
MLPYLNSGEQSIMLAMAIVTFSGDSDGLTEATIFISTVDVIGGFFSGAFPQL